MISKMMCFVRCFHLKYMHVCVCMSESKINQHSDVRLNEKNFINCMGDGNSLKNALGFNKAFPLLQTVLDGEMDIFPLPLDT